MNGFELMAEGYRKAAAQGRLEEAEAEKKCKALDFLSKCDEEDLFNLFDSTAFNEIIMAYVRRAVNNVPGLDDVLRVAVRNEVRSLFSEISAKEIM